MSLALGKQSINAIKLLNHLFKGKYLLNQTLCQIKFQ
jgi:hypothetical protein